MIFFCKISKISIVLYYVIKDGHAQVLDCKNPNIITDQSCDYIKTLSNFLGYYQDIIPNEYLPNLL